MRSTMEARFWAKVDMSSGLFGCWIWTGFRDRKGYGRLMVDGLPLLAHRVAYELQIGPLASGTPLLHSCDNPPCVRVAHLRPGTIAENNAEMRERGRQAVGERNGASKITAAIATAIRTEYEAGGVSQAVLASRYGLAQNTIHKVLSGKTWAIPS